MKTEMALRRPLPARTSAFACFRRSLVVALLILPGAGAGSFDLLGLGAKKKRLAALSNTTKTHVPMGESASGAEVNRTFNPDDNPVLSELMVRGKLPDGVVRRMPFHPRFEPTEPGHRRDFKCDLDYQMGSFTLSVEPQPPAILSQILRDGHEVKSRLDLVNIALFPGEKTIFSLGVTDQSTRGYTLIVRRRVGTSEKLLALQAVTGNMSVPFHPGELQEWLVVEQAFYEDLFKVEYVKGDAGQEIGCSVASRRTTSSSGPTQQHLLDSPEDYMPALEQLTPLETRSRYDPLRGIVATCIVPIDTWRELTVQLRIRTADRMSRRDVKINVSRSGCKSGHFFYKGFCSTYCPTGLYKQRFNWRCGRCNKNCAFCSSWNKCDRCHRNTDLEEYQPWHNGACLEKRIHHYRVYFDLALKIGASCAALLSCYLTCLVCVVVGKCVFRKDGKEYDFDRDDPFRARVPGTGGSSWVAKPAE